MDKAKYINEKFSTVSIEEDELVFFSELIEDGITLTDIKNYCPRHYEYSKKFMEEHGLV